jgi:hypothetical protein
MIDATPLLHLYAPWRRASLARQDPVAAQEKQLLRLIRRAQGTRFGRDHGFNRIATVADFQARVPLRRYEDFWTEYWRAPFPVLWDVTWPGLIPYFALTAGTSTGRSKHIPVTSDMNRANRRAALDTLVHHITARPDSRILAGRSFILGGSTDLQRLATGVYAGDLSGIVARDMPFWARLRAFPPLDLALELDWEKKVRRMAPASLEADIRSISGTPSWLLYFFDELMRLAPERPRRLDAFYPGLELVVHGGVNFSPYRHRFEELLEGSRAELREVYPASEGFIAIADRGPDAGLRMLLDNGLFYEFVPVDELDWQAPTRHWIANAELFREYALVLSSNAGLWAYVLGDTVRLIERNPPRLIVTGRTGYLLSAFGEHVRGEEIETAVSRAASGIGADVADFSVGALVAARGDGADAHLYLVEFAEKPAGEEQLRQFAALIDAALMTANADYAAHRHSGQLTPPQVRVMEPGAFARWMKHRGKLGGQNKVPRIINDLALFDDLRRFTDQSRLISNSSQE